MSRATAIAERIRTSTRAPRSDCVFVICPTCQGRTAAFQTDPPLVRRVCGNRHVSVWRRTDRGLVFDHLPLTPEERRVAPERWPLCAFGGCDRVRRAARPHASSGSAYCHGHEKQLHRGQPLAPLLSADLVERGRAVMARRRVFARSLTPPPS